MSVLGTLEYIKSGPTHPFSLRSAKTHIPMSGVVSYGVHTGSQCRSYLYWKLSLFAEELKHKSGKMICLLGWGWVPCSLVQFWALKPNRNFLHLCRKVLQPQAESFPHHSSTIIRFTEITLWVNVHSGVELQKKIQSIIRNNQTSGLGKEEKKALRC